MKFDIHGGGCGHSCCLRVENMSVQIGSDKILQEVNLHVHCGEMVALIGPNGAGKSTFLKAILGQREYEGIIAFSEPGQRSKKPRIGYVPQSPAFDPSDPVSVADLFAENVLSSLFLIMVTNTSSSFLLTSQTFNLKYITLPF